MKDIAPNVPVVRVLLIARHPIVQESVRLLIESNRNMVVTGAYPFCTDSGKSYDLSEADVALIYLSSGDRVEIISDLLHLSPRLRVVAAVAGDDLDLQTTALNLGAVGIVRHEQSSKLLIEAIRQTYNGETWLNQVLLNKLLDKGRPHGKKAGKFDAESQTESLTPRELGVIQMIGKGLKNKQIGEKLFICEATVRHHLSSIYGKLGVSDRLNLVIYAYNRGLIKNSPYTGESASMNDDLESVN